MARGFVYLVGVMDWFTRRILAWRLSNTLEASFCIDAVEEALANYGCPQIFNTDQGSQFTSADFTSVLSRNAIAISMDGKGAWRDNVFVERFWRTVKYEEVYLYAYDSVANRSAAISTSTMPKDHTPPLTGEPPIRFTSIRCRSARQPNPGRGSTYRRGISVQRTGATSNITDVVLGNLDASAHRTTNQMGAAAYL